VFRSLQFLASSSRGNAAVLSTDQCRILIDVGLSGKQILKHLAHYGLRIQDIDAVFLTHEHSDHTQGIRGLVAFRHLLFFANHATIHALQAKQDSVLQWQSFDTGDTFHFRDIEITSYAIPHDAEDPVAYTFTSTTQRDHQVAWITDLGYIPNTLIPMIQNAHLLVLEANFDPHLLEMDILRPWSVKQRIRGRHGHLSNVAALHALCDHLPLRAQKIFLDHLSHDCNNSQLLASLLAEARRQYPLLPPDIEPIPPGTALDVQYFFNER
jgi:phosphoribosyl 1,2-cyclic phosphodiesterase